MMEFSKKFGKKKKYFQIIEKRKKNIAWEYISIMDP
jgi:hypothetical protein